MTKTHQALLDLAANHHRAPIGTHLVLHETENPEAVVLDGPCLGGVIARTADRFKTPMAVPLMDLTLEKEALLLALGVPAGEIESFHFTEIPACTVPFEPTPRMRAACGAISTVAKRDDLLPMGMGIGPFSLMTKLISDPITPVFLAGTGATADEEPEIALVEALIEAGTEQVIEYIGMQAEAGAKAFILCEPAANTVYFSPNQLEESYEIFERFAMAPLRRIKAAMDSAGMALVFHDCGELTPEMIRRFSTLDAAMMSLGSSRALWEDAALLPKETVLYGNLPTKRFYSPQLTVGEVTTLSREILTKMRSTGHPFILGSECDVLSVPGSEKEILSKVEAFLSIEE